MPDVKKQSVPTIQIDVDKDMEKFLVETAIEDYRLAEQYRNSQDYGIDAKGVAYSFDSFIKKIKDMYYGNREPKSIPWKNCSNRSMKIAMSIVEL